MSKKIAKAEGVYQRNPDKRNYTIMYRDADRKQRWKSGYSTIAEAKDARAKLMADVSTGAYVAPLSITVEQFFIDEWLPAIRETIRPSTWNGYRSHLKIYIRPLLGSRKLQKVRGSDLNRFYADLLVGGSRNGGPLSPTTVRRVHATIHRGFSDATRWERVTSNPADKADPPMSQSPEMKTWTAEELRTFLDFIADDRLFPAFHLAANTGLRRGEVLGLKWDDIDFEAPSLSVRRTLLELGGSLSESKPKTRTSDRQVALDARMVTVLRKWRKTQLEDGLAMGHGYDLAGFLFTRADGEPVHPDFLTKRFASMNKAAGLPKIRLHDLRHTHATLALAAGVHPKVVSERLGHSSISITLDTYSHAIPAMQAEAAERIAELVFGT